MNAAPPLETTGTTSGLRFKLERMIGKGSFGLVYRAVQLGLDRPVALKLLHPDALENMEQVGRFLNEARVTAALKHPHIVEVIDHGVAGEQPWIAYEYLAGATVRALLPPHGFEWTRAVTIGAQVANALELAHTQDVVHRDIKAENVMEAEPGHFKVTDFGLAKWNHRAAFRTGTLSCMGTPAYIAPELIATGKASPATDQYALGVLLYELLTGKVPFAGDTAAAVVEGHLKTAPPPPSRVRPGIPRAVDEAVLTALAKNPKDRHRSAGALAAALERVLDRSSVDLAPDPAGAGEVSPFRRFGIYFAIAGAVALTAVTLDPLGLRGRPARPPEASALPVPSVFAPVSRLGTTEAAEMRGQLEDILARADVRAQRTKQLAALLNPLFLRLADAAPEAALLETEIRADQRTLTVLRERILAYYPEPALVPPAEMTLVARILVDAARGWCWLENMANTREAIDATLAAHGDRGGDGTVLAEMESRAYSAGGDGFVLESARMVREACARMESRPELLTPELADLMRDLYWLGSIAGFRAWPAEAEVRVREIARALAPAPGGVLVDCAAAVWELGHAKMGQVKAAREAADRALTRFGESGMPGAADIAARIKRELATAPRASPSTPPTSRALHRFLPAR